MNGWCDDALQGAPGVPYPTYEYPPAAAYPQHAYGEIYLSDLTHSCHLPSPRVWRSAACNAGYVGSYPYGTGATATTWPDDPAAQYTGTVCTSAL